MFTARDQLDDKLSGLDVGADLPDSDTLRSHLYNLRRAVDKPFDHAMIETLAGRGYRTRSRHGDGTTSGA